MKAAKNWILAVLGVVVLAGGYYGWRMYDGTGLPAGIVGGNGRIEATEIDVSAKTAGRIKEILVDEEVSSLPDRCWRAWTPSNWRLSGSRLKPLVNAP